MLGFRYHIRQTFKVLVRKRNSVLWSLVGLAFGIASGVFVLLYARYEFSWDKHFAHYDRMFRFTSVGTIGNNSFHVALTPEPLTELLRKQQEVEAATHFTKAARMTVTCRGQKAQEERFIFTDTAFFKVFSMDFLSGSPESVFRDPNGLVITASTAERYFGRSNPIGKELVRDHRSYVVTGVVADVPPNTHFKFDFLALQEEYSPDTMGFSPGESWLNVSTYHYALLRAQVDLERFTNSLNQQKDSLSQVQVQWARKVLNSPQEALNIDLVPEPVEEIHLFSQAMMSPEAGMQFSYLAIFLSLALLILLFTVFNFINLTSRNTKAFQFEIAARRMAGASRKQLFVQFVAESLVYSGVALFFALVLVELLLPLFNEVFRLQIGLWKVNNQWYNFSLLLFIFLISFLTGSYPAWKLLLRKNAQPVSGGKNVIGRLVLALELILFTGIVVVTLGMFLHIRQLQQRDKGYAMEQLYVLAFQNEYDEGFELLKKQLLQIQGVASVSASYSYPGGDYNVSSYRFASPVKDPLVVLTTDAVDPDYFETMGMGLKSGCFLKGICLDTLGILVNESVVQQHELLKPIGEKFEFYTENPSDTIEYTIKGVLRDFVNGKPEEGTRPMLIRLLKQGEPFRYVWVRNNELFNAQSVVQMNQLLEQNYPAESLHWMPFATLHDRAFASDWRMIRIGIVLCIISLYIALWGLIIFSINHWERKVGINRIKRLQGASQLRLLLEQHFSLGMLLLCAILIGMGLGFGLLSYWMTGFNGVFEISPLFPLSCFVVLMAIFTTAAILVTSIRMRMPDAYRTVVF